MRAFIALRAGDLFEFGPGAPPADPEDPLEHVSIEELEKNLQGAGGKLRFVKPEARHLTLRFLGQVEDAQAKRLGASVKEVAKGFKAFPAGARGVGFFPNAQRPKVVWVGIDDPEKRLVPLHDALDERLGELGFERAAAPFVPHVTIARVIQRPPGDGLARAVDPLVASRFGWTKATGMELIESTLTPKGPIYKTRAEADFAAGK